MASAARNDAKRRLRHIRLSASLRRRSGWGSGSGSSSGRSGNSSLSSAQLCDSRIAVLIWRRTVLCTAAARCCRCPLRRPVSAVSGLRFRFRFRFRSHTLSVLSVSLRIAIAIRRSQRPSFCGVSLNSLLRSLHRLSLVSVTRCVAAPMPPPQHSFRWSFLSLASAARPASAPHICGGAVRA